MIDKPLRRLNSHRRFVSKLSEATGSPVGYSPDHIVLAGDSAGGLLAADTAIAARDAGLPVPAGQVLLSALTSSDMDIKYRAMKHMPMLQLSFAINPDARRAIDGIAGFVGYVTAARGEASA